MPPTEPYNEPCCDGPTKPSVPTLSEIRENQLHILENQKLILSRLDGVQGTIDTIAR